MASATPPPDAERVEVTALAFSPDARDAAAGASSNETINSAQDSVTERPHEPGSVLAGIALAIPFFASILLLCFESTAAALGVGWATVIFTAGLLALDARMLRYCRKNGSGPTSPLALFLGVILLWIVIYPAAYFWRRRATGPDLRLPALLASLSFGAVQVVGLVQGTAELPACTSPEVTQLVDQLLHSSPSGASIKSIGDYEEVSYDAQAGRRAGTCVVRAEQETSRVEYFVEWVDQAKGSFGVRVQPQDLPSCSNPAVVKILEQLIRQAPSGAQLESTTAHREIRYDRKARRRFGQCVVRIGQHSFNLRYVVEWQDQAKGQFVVRIQE